MTPPGANGTPRGATTTSGTRVDDTDAEAGQEPVRVWLVERTYGDDELNLVILTYATPDGERYLRKERAITSFTGPARETPAAIDADPWNLGRTPPDDVEYYREAARRTRAEYAPDDPI